METKNNYKSFNKGKTIDELQYNMFQNIAILKAFKTDYEFIKHLIEASIYKPNTRNLFEILQQYKKEIELADSELILLIEEATNYNNKIAQKIEYNDLECDSLCIEKFDVLEQKFHTFFYKTINSKRQMFEYLHSVIKIC